MTMQVESMISNPVFIKDLIILQNPKVFEMIKPDVEAAKKYGVNIGYLHVNSFVYEYKTTNIIFLRNYIKTICILVEAFGNMFHDEIYTLRVQGLLNDECYLELYNDNTFHWIFNDINNTFNIYIDDIFLHDDFYIYGSETSLEVILILYNIFSEDIVTALKPYVNYNILMKMNGIRTVRWYPYLYDKIFQNLEDLYLPFY